MKKWLLFLLFLLPNIALGQVFNLQYQYTEICSEQQKRVTIPLDLSGKNTLAFFGYSRTFTPQEIQNNEHILWLQDIYSKWREYYPCAEIKELVTEAAKSATESGDVDLNQPIVLVSADFGYRNGGVVTTSGGFNQTNLKTGMARGMLLTAGTDYIGNIGYYRVNPINENNSSLINTNILLLQQSVVGNLTFGLLGDLGWAGSYFGLHTLTFGKLNGYPFQDNTVMLGHTKKILNTRRLLLSTNMIFSYTYRVKVFNLEYWLEDYVGIKPFVNVGFKITPTFGLNISYTTNIRTDNFGDTSNYGILMGGRVLF